MVVLVGGWQWSTNLKEENQRTAKLLAEIERALQAQRDEEARLVRYAEEALARLLQNRFERIADGVLDRQQNVVWAATDNGHGINWRDAVSYCRSLGSGWSLPSVTQLLGLYAHPTRFRLHLSDSKSTIWPATNLIRFTGSTFWSAEVDEELAGETSPGFYVDLSVGEWESWFRGGLPKESTQDRALCVRLP